MSERSLNYAGWVPIESVRRRRAAPLAPDDRRAVLVEATIPLLRTHGLAVTTRQIAEAAGVAEGTIFRVFPDKASLVRAAVEAALDPSDDEQRLLAIGLDAPLEERIEAAVRIGHERLSGVFELIAKVGVDYTPRPRTTRPHHVRIMAASRRLFEPDRDRLRVDPAEAARLLNALTIAGSHPRIMDGRPLTPREITSLLLDGVRRC